MLFPLPHTIPDPAPSCASSPKKARNEKPDLEIDVNLKWKIQFAFRADENQKTEGTENEANHRDCLTRGSIGRYATDSLVEGGK